MVRRELSSGCEQVVILGAGLDVLGMLLREDFPEVRVIEVDHPATARWKWDRIRNGLTLPERVAIDLENDAIEKWLQLQSSFEPERRTLFLAEGLLMYLSDEAVDRLFRGERHRG